MGNLSKSRAWAIATILIVACLVALGLGLGLGLRNKDDDDDDTPTPQMTSCPGPPSSSRLTTDSPIYSPPTESVEGLYRFGAVASDSPPCSVIGNDIMFRKGGSAMDAAIAALVCAGVYNPQSCGIGGGFMMTYYERATMSKKIVMAREMAPGASTENMFKQEGWDSLEGGKAVGVPGEVQGLYEAWKLGGKLPWSTLFQPSIKMCNEGFTVGQLLEADIESNARYYDNHTVLKEMVTNPTTNQLYKQGDTIRLPKLGSTLQKIADDPFTFYNGSLATDIVSDLTDAGGIITAADLENYTAAVKDALTLTLSSGYTVMSPPPPSSGGVVLLIMSILDGFDFTEDSISTEAKAVETYHRIIEAFKHGFSVRTQFGDPDVENQAFKDTLAALIANVTSNSFGAEMRALITDRTQNTSFYEPQYSVNASDAGTTHLSVLAPNGDAVSVTSTINIWFGSKIVGSRTGIVFNDEMDDFSTPDTTNFFGIPASEANFIKPGKRPLSSMSPTIITNATSGDVRLVAGASGGSRIITSTAFTAIETLLFKLGVKEAIDFPKMHHQLLPDQVYITNRFQQVLRDGLEARGHKFNVRSLMSAVQAVLQQEDGHIFANCDHSKFGVPDGTVIGRFYITYTQYVIQIPQSTYSSSQYM